MNARKSRVPSRLILVLVGEDDRDVANWDIYIVQKNWIYKFNEQPRAIIAVLVGAAIGLDFMVINSQDFN